MSSFLKWVISGAIVLGMSGHLQKATFEIAKLAAEAQQHQMCANSGRLKRDRKVREQ